MSEAEKKPYEDIKQEKVKEYNDWKEKVENTARYKEILDYGAVFYVLFKGSSDVSTTMSIFISLPNFKSLCFLLVF